MAYILNIFSSYLQGNFAETSIPIWQVVLIAIIVTVVASIIRQHFKTRNFPPGPRGWPIVGNLFQLNARVPHHTLEDWAHKYGDIYSFSFLRKPVVVVSSFELIKEAIIERLDDFAGRPPAYRLGRYLRSGEHICFCPISPRWALMKKCVMTGMKMYGEGLKRLEDITLDILSDLRETLQSHNGEPFDPLEDMHQSVANIMSSIAFSKKLPAETLRSFLHIEKELLRLLAPAGPGSELDVFPWLHYLPRKTYKDIDRLIENDDRWFKKQMADRRAKYVPGNPTCVLDFLWDQQTVRVDNDGKLLLPDLSIQLILGEIHIAGTTTTTFALYTMIGIWATKPHFQQRVQQEVETHLGERLPRLSDRPAMPYTEATILETLRYISQFPVALPHVAIKDTTLGGYDLPKGTEIWLNLWNMHHDKDFWGDPWEFRPERFLAEDGSLVPPEHPTRRHLLPFGAGRRVCVGEALARNRMFLFVAFILQRFTFVPAEGYPEPRTDPREYGIRLVLQAEKFKIKALPRTE